MGILYLVLLGLAATTITQKVLDAFRNLTEGLETSTNYTQTAVSDIYQAFESKKLKDEPERAKPIWDKSQKVKKAVNDLNDYIVQIRTEMEKECGGFDSSENDYKNREDVDISPRIMIEKGRAKELKKRILDTRQVILDNLDDNGKRSIKISLNADDPKKLKGGVKTSWEEMYFGDGTPLTAAITALTKIQADLRNTESDVIKYILGSVDKAVINLDQFDAVAVAPTAYVLVGQQYTADVFLTASSSTVPDVFVGGSKLPIADGKGKYTVTATHEGEFKWVGTVKVIDADGKVREYQTKEQTYRVAKPSATVSPDKMLVFYMGVDNPVTVSAPGIAKENLRVSLSGPLASAGTITGSNGSYIVRVNKSGSMSVTVSGEFEKGKTSVLGSTEFRCKSLPTPHATFGGKGGGAMPAVALRQQTKLMANLPDFDFAVQFSINHFTMFIQKPRSDAQPFESSGNTLNAAMQSAMASITPGTRITFSSIFATGPDGIRRQLDDITFVAN